MFVDETPLCAIFIYEKNSYSSIMNNKYLFLRIQQVYFLFSDMLKSWS